MKRIRTNRRSNYRGSLRPAFLDILESRNLLSGTPTAAEAFGQIPLSFEVNQGQTDAQVKFLARGTNGTVFFTPGATVLSLAGNGSDAALYMSLGGANPNSNIVGLDKLSSVTNNFVGNDPSKWQTNIANYGRVEEQGIYPGIDLSYYGNNQQLEYDFNVSPGADPNAIRMSFQGAQSTSIDSQGNLVLQINGSSVVEHAPVLYQVSSNGQRESVSGHFVIEADGQVGFAVGAYDTTRALVIDPTLDYSTYLGGTGGVSGNKITVDATGNAYVVGDVASAAFPTTPGAFQPNLVGVNDAFVAKLNAAGTALVYATYLGGSGFIDAGTDIAVDNLGNAYITGQTDSSNFPTTPGAFQTTIPNTDGTIFVTKLNPTGSQLIYSTFLGGSLQDISYGIALDGAGSAYVTGTTSSADFPTTPGAFASATGGQSSSAFVAKFNPAGSGLVYSTLLDGGPKDSTTIATAIAVNATGEAYVTGSTQSPIFPTTVGAYQTTLSGKSDVFVTEFNSTGSALVFSTFIGGEGYDSGRSIAVDASGNVYVGGSSASPSFIGSTVVNGVPVPQADYPTTPGAFQRVNLNPNKNLNPGSNGVISKLNPSGSQLVFSTFLGGSGDSAVTGLAVDQSGNVYVGGTVGIVGTTTSTAFPVIAGALDNQLGDLQLGFVTKIDSTGSFLYYSTYLGGEGDLNSVGGVALDSAGHLYVTGLTNSTNFPTTPAALQTTNPPGNTLAFVTKFDLTTQTTTTLNAAPNPSVAGAPVTFTATVAQAPGLPGAPSGSVTFLNGNIPLATIPLVNGQAVYTTDTLAVGTQTITAVYSGDLSFTSSTASVTETVLSLAAPTVVSVQQSGFVGPTPMVQLVFSQPLDVASAQRRRNYLITDFHGHTIGIRSIQYDAAAQSVTLTLAHRLNSHYNYRLTVKGTPPNGVKSLAGTRLDGTGKGHPGTNYHVIFAKSSPPISKPAAQHANHPRGPAAVRHAQSRKG